MHGVDFAPNLSTGGATQICEMQCVMRSIASKTEGDFCELETPEYHGEDSHAIGGIDRVRQGA
ncbi:MAG: hypothetical protein CMJ46_05055 [Planctomyces sp.]|nr:hypothetical protein [Planctomyces sp.]